MNTRIGLLGAVLAAQVLIIAVLLISSGVGAGEEARSLLPFEPVRTVSLDIATEDEEVGLARDDDGWRLDGGLPADDGKVGEVLEKLAKASAAWPVATSASSAERFEVTEENFQRRLVVESESGETATLYLGSSPGYRRVHARADGADEVYSIDFSNYEAPADVDQWLDKKLLRPRGDVTAVARADGWALGLVAAEAAKGQDTEVTGGAAADAAGGGAEDDADTDPGGDLSDSGQSDAAVGGDMDGDTDGRDGRFWLVDGVRADAEAAARLVGRFADLSVLGIAEKTGESKGSFTVLDGEGEYRLELFFEEDQDDYSVVSSRVDGRFEIATYIAEQMLIDVGDLLPKQEEPELVEDPDADDEPVDVAGSATEPMP